MRSCLAIESLDFYANVSYPRPRPLLQQHKHRQRHDTIENAIINATIARTIETIILLHTKFTNLCLFWLLLPFLLITLKKS